MVKKYYPLGQDSEKHDHNLNGLAFPMYLNHQGRFGRSYVDVEDGNYEKVRENIRQILMTEQGERAMRPEFGGNFFEVFALNTMSRRALRAKDVKRAIERWEPRVDIIKIQPLEPTPEEKERGIARTRIEMKIKNEELVATVETGEGSVTVNYNQ